MINHIISRMISAGIWGIFLGLMLHLDHVRGQQLGRDAFLAKEAARYDHQFAQPTPIIAEIIACLILLCVLLVIYEAMAFVIFKILEKINPPAEN